jgi:hypothetical protein
MKLRPLLIGPDERASIKALIAKAAADPVPFEEVREAADKRAHTGDGTDNSNLEYTICIPSGYHVTYTHEHQRPGEACECRHISFSVEDAAPGTGPNPAAIEVLLSEFGFKNKIGGLPSWMTHTADNLLIIEFVEPLDGDMERLQQKA